MNPPVRAKSWRIPPQREEIRRVTGELGSFLESVANSALRKKILTVASELLRNALEHGVLRIEGKEQLLAEGTYEQVLSERESVVEENRSICLDVQLVGDSAKLEVSCDAPPFVVSTTAPLESLSGRGLQLVRGLTTSCVIDEAQNRVIVQVGGNEPDLILP